MKLPTLFIPHGGGPCFFMDPNGGPADPMWQPMQAYLAGLIDSLPERPRAILLVSGHWEESQVTVHTGARPDLLYDYDGFPEHTYRLRWDAPGAPDLARRARALIEAAGFPVGTEADRGWDHGVFVPMKVAVPGADIPLAQLSLRADLDPQAHIAIGRALAPLRDEGVLIVGSGMSFHNLRERGPHVTARADAWDAALTDAVTDPDPARRAERVAAWDTLPHARFAHPREEHLLPLMVALGAGGDDPAHRDFAGRALGWAVSAYRFG
ncbi:putative extradiol dioxygenase [Sphingomonas changbaiensis NBRC 104936]|uniref:Putative extradiol dioxygenase n=1 Tax=Sphingomonas changbaiensis NBRC 104936 TaxID=1219043 RepID=A0A0E9MTI9_9SPHN|nr:class III extradiol ring-cleavage dioxygenase [Sphingomonas changbaiensis]GAO40435.1 putative extradiol dioxygenase [Sphingomonas changbaiensis NBRC 104936]